jgi:hypothetical protein
LKAAWRYRAPPEARFSGLRRPPAICWTGRVSGEQKPISRRDALASQSSRPHKSTRSVLRYLALMICNPSLRYFLCSKARHQRGESARHEDFNSIGRVFLRQNPIGSAGMRMFFCHRPYMVYDRWNAKNTLDHKLCEALRRLRASWPPPRRSVVQDGKRLQRAIVLALKHLAEHYPMELGAPC